MDERANHSISNPIHGLPGVLGILMALALLAAMFAPGLGEAQPSQGTRVCYVIAAVERSPAAGVDSAAHECAHSQQPHVVIERPAPTRAPLAER